MRRGLHSLGLVAIAALVGGCGFLAGVDFFGVERADAIASVDGDDDDGGSIANDGGVSEGDAATSSPDAAKTFRIYVLGGTEDRTELPDVGVTFFSDIQADGSLGSWNKAPDLPLARMYAPAVAGDDFVALVSGLTSGPGERSNFAIGRAPGGAVANFFESTEALAVRRSRGGAARHGDTVFVIGGVGVNGAKVLDSVEKGVVRADGVGAFTAARTLPSPLARMAIATNASTLFVIGGDDGSTKTTAIRAARFEGGDLSAFTQVGTLPAALTYAQAIVHDKALLVVGGETAKPVTDVLRFPLEDGGALGAPVSGTPLPLSMSRHQVVRHGDHVYVVGGATGDTAAPSTHVFIGDLGENGSISNWRTGPSLPEARVFHGAVVL